MNELPKVPVGLATKVGYGLTALGVIASVVGQIESNFPVYAHWCLVASAVVAAFTTVGRQIQAAAIAHASIGSLAAEVAPELPGLAKEVRDAAQKP